VSPESATGRAFGDEVILLGPAGSRPFDAAGLEAELRAMWKSASAERGEGGGAVYRAALANLVVPVEPERQSQLAPVLTDVMRRHPSRLFLIAVGADKDARSAGELRARVTAVCHRREGGGGLVCSEQVVLQGDARAGVLVPSAVRALLVGDLPMVLLDLQVMPSLPWMGELIETADLVLEDSGMRERPEEEETLWDLLGREGSARVHDLAWARLTPWREILAEVFDGAPMIRALRALTEVTIEHCGEFPPSPAWLLAGWLAARLDWTLAGASSRSIDLSSPGGPVRIMMGAHPDGDGRGLRRIRVRSGPPAALDLEIAHQGREPSAAVSVRSPAPSRREVAFGYREFAACIVGEIQRHEPNPSLEGAARLAREMLRAWRDRR
jgi:glucose-6-phosphate dehydrogenase assembly protein OpcA